jgi:hypothetical protein
MAGRSSLPEERGSLTFMAIPRRSGLIAVQFVLASTRRVSPSDINKIARWLLVLHRVNTLATERKSPRLSASEDLRSNPVLVLDETGSIIFKCSAAAMNHAPSFGR